MAGRDVTRWARRALDAATVALLVVAIWAFVHSRRSAAERSAGPMSGQPLDSILPPVVTVDSGMARVMLFASPGAPRLLFVFRSDCPACEAQKADWLDLARAADSLNVHVVAISPRVGMATEYGYFGHDSPIEVVALVEPSAIWAGLQTRVVPTSIVVDGRNRMRFHHRGVLGRPEYERIRHLLREIAPDVDQRSSPAPDAIGQPLNQIGGVP